MYLYYVYVWVYTQFACVHSVREKTCKTCTHGQQSISVQYLARHNYHYMVVGVLAVTPIRRRVAHNVRPVGATVVVGQN